MKIEMKNRPLRLSLSLQVWTAFPVRIAVKR
jgi:hypothetical protein